MMLPIVAWLVRSSFLATLIQVGAHTAAPTEMPPDELTLIALLIGLGLVVLVALGPGLVRGRPRTRVRSGILFFVLCGS